MTHKLEDTPVQKLPGRHYNFDHASRAITRAITQAITTLIMLHSFRRLVTTLTPGSRGS